MSKQSIKAQAPEQLTSHGLAHLRRAMACGNHGEEQWLLVPWLLKKTLKGWKLNMFLRKNTTYLFPMSKHISELISNFSVFFLAFSVYPDMSTEVRLFCACLRSIPLEGLRLPLLAPHTARAAESGRSHRFSWIYPAKWGLIVDLWHCFTHINGINME